MPDAIMQVTAGIRRESRRNDGDPVNLRGLRDGSMVWGPNWLEMLSFEGRVFEAQFGTIDTPVATQLTYDTTLPSLTVDVPPDIVAIPLYFEIQFTATVAITHVQLLYGTTRPWNASAAAGTVLTPLNLRIGSSRTSACKVGHTFTVTGGDVQTNARYLSHLGNQGDLDALAIDANYKWSCAKMPILPIVEDGGNISAMFYNNSASTRAWAKLVWAEFNKEEIRLPQ